MENVSKALALAATVCFVCAGGFVYGALSAMGRLDFAWYFTFSDYVNYSAAIVIVFGFVYAFLLLQDADWRDIQARKEVMLNELNIEKSPSGVMIARVFLILLFIALAVTAYFALSISWKALLTAVAPCVILIMFQQWAYDRISSTLGPTLGVAVDSAISALVVSMIFGAFAGTMISYFPVHHTVCSTSGQIATKFTLPLERGIAVLASDRLLFLPWSEVKAVELSEDQSMAKGKPATYSISLTKECGGRPH